MHFFYVSPATESFTSSFDYDCSDIIFGGDVSEYMVELLAEFEVKRV